MQMSVSALNSLVLILFPQIIVTIVDVNDNAPIFENGTLMNYVCVCVIGKKRDRLEFIRSSI